MIFFLGMTKPETDTMQPEALKSDGQAENRHNAVHRLVLPADGAAAVGRVVPVARAENSWVISLSWSKIS